MENGDEEDLARLKLNIPPKTDGLEKKKKKKRPKVEGQLEPGVEGQEKPKKKKIKLLNKELKDKGDQNSFFSENFFLFVITTISLKCGQEMGDIHHNNSSTRLKKTKITNTMLALMLL